MVGDRHNRKRLWILYGCMAPTWHCLALALYCVSAKRSTLGACGLEEGSMLNQVVIIGYAGGAPKALGDRGCAVSLATTRRWRDREDQLHEDTQWHRCVIWGPTAQAALERIAQGDLVHVTGRIQYPEDDGYRAEIVVSTWRTYGRRDQRRRGRPQHTTRRAAKAPSETPPETPPVEPDDIPF